MCIAEDATHGDVDVVVAVDDVHTRYVGCQHLLQVTSATVVNHLLSDKRGGHWHLCQTLCLTGGCGDGSSHASLDVVYYIGKGKRIAGRWCVVWVLLKHLCGILLGMLHVETCQITEGYKTECILAQIAMKVCKVFQQCITCLFNTAYAVVALCLCKQLTHSRLALFRLLSTDYTGAESK